MTGVSKVFVTIILLDYYIHKVGSLLTNNPCVHSCTDLCNKFEGDFSQVGNHLIAENLTTCWEVEAKNESDLKTESEVTSENPEVLGDRTVFEMEFSPQKKRSLEEHSFAHEGSLQLDCNSENEKIFACYGRCLCNCPDCKSVMKQVGEKHVREREELDANRRTRDRTGCFRRKNSNRPCPNN